MPRPGTAKATSAWLATSGLVAGVTAIGVGASADVASATTPHDICTGGATLVSSGVCQILFRSSTKWVIPKNVDTLQVLSVGGGGGGGGGTTYGPGGGGGGGAVKECTLHIVDLSSALLVHIGSGGTGGINGSTNLYDNEYGGEYGGAGAGGGDTTATSSTGACDAEGGSGGAPGYNYYSDDLPDGTYFGGGGASGSGNAGGSADGLVDANTNDCTYSAPDWEYNITASGGGGASAAGSVPSGSVSGAGGAGSTPTSGLFAGATGTYGGGGGGGGGEDCETTDFFGVGGTGGGGDGGGAPAQIAGPLVQPHRPSETAPVAGTAGTGGGGGGGTGLYPGDGVAGASGGSGVVVVRFAALSTAAVAASVYFATAKSTLTSADKRVLDRFVNEDVAQGKTVVHVVGYADYRGSKPYNEALSQARANVAAAYVKARFALAGVSATVTAEGRGVTTTSPNLARDRVALLTATLPHGSA